LTHNSPGVSHEYPAERRYHGGLVFGAGRRGAVDDLLKADAVAAPIDRQAELVSAAHAYTVERSTTVIDTVKRPAQGR